MVRVIDSPPSEPIGSVLVAPAMGVPRKLYAKFAKYLSESGLLAMTLDYRGAGEFARQTRVTFAEWAHHDLQDAVSELRQRAPDVPLLWVGHSAGGQLMGLLPEAPIKAALFLGSGSAYWRHYSGTTKYQLWALFHVVIPLVSPIAGYYPMSRIGGGEDIPRAAAEQWAKWGRHPDYIGSYQRELTGKPYYRYSGPLRSVAFTDDEYAPERAVRALLELYPEAKKEVRVVSPADVGAKRIGHFGIFRQEHRDTIWREAREWLLGQLQ